MAERRLARCGEYPSVLCSTTGLPTLIDSSAPAYPIQPLPDRPEEGRPVPGREGPAAGELRRRGDRRAPSTWEAVRLREANWYPTRNVGASEAIQISANRAECVCQWIDYIRYEKLPASSPKERDVGDADRESSVSAAARQLKTPLPTVSRKVFELESHPRTKLFNRSSRKDQQPKQRSSENRRHDALRSKLASWSAFHSKFPSHPFCRPRSAMPQAVQSDADSSSRRAAVRPLGRTASRRQRSPRW